MDEGLVSLAASGSAGCRLLETSTVAADSEATEAMGINKERFEAIKVLKAQGWTVSAIARHLSIDRKTVRTWMKAEDWRPYEREVRTPTQLDAHTAWLRARAPEVNYSARILFQELRR